MKILDLFSGIGGFSLGLESCGFQTMAFCEINEYCQKVLKKHWPNVPIFEDVQNVSRRELVANGITKIDIITGGFPCQDISVAGRQAGIKEGTRSGLWSEIARLIGELGPKFVIVENVSNLLMGPKEKPGAWFGRVLGDLAQLGYDAEWHNLPASAYGAPHRRERIYLIAYPNKIGFTGQIYRWDYSQMLRWRESGASLLPPNFDGVGTAEDSYAVRSHDGFSEFMGEISGYGNAVVPHIVQQIGRAIIKSYEVKH